MLPGSAILRVCDLPAVGANTAVGFEVSTADSVVSAGTRFRFCMHGQCLVRRQELLG